MDQTIGRYSTRKILFNKILTVRLVVACYGKIGSDLNALNSTAWIATASVEPKSISMNMITNELIQILYNTSYYSAFIRKSQ